MRATVLVIFALFAALAAVGIGLLRGGRVPVAPATGIVGVRDSGPSTSVGVDAEPPLPTDSVRCDASRRTAPRLIELGPIVPSGEGDVHEGFGRRRHRECSRDQELVTASEASVEVELEEVATLDLSGDGDDAWMEGAGETDGIEAAATGTGTVRVTLSIPTRIDLRSVVVTLRSLRGPLRSIATFPTPDCLAREVDLSIVGAPVGEHEVVIRGNLGGERFVAEFPRVFVRAGVETHEPRLLELNPVVLLARTPQHRR